MDHTEVFYLNKPSCDRPKCPICGCDMVYPDLMRDHLITEIATLTAELDAARKELVDMKDMQERFPYTIEKLAKLKRELADCKDSLELWRQLMKPGKWKETYDALVEMGEIGGGE